MIETRRLKNVVILFQTIYTLTYQIKITAYTCVACF